MSDTSERPFLHPLPSTLLTFSYRSSSERNTDTSISSQGSSSRRGSRQVTIEESPLLSSTHHPRAGTSAIRLEDGFAANNPNLGDPSSDPLLQLSNTYTIVLERDPPPPDDDFEEDDEYDPSLGVHFYIPPPTSSFEDQSTSDFLGQLTGGGSLLREASTGSSESSGSNSSMLIIRSVTPLSSGKSSPAQRCGMLGKGDVVLRINEETVWGRGVMELGEIISRQMSWQEGGDNTKKMRIELLCVIGEGAEVIRGLEEVSVSLDRHGRRELCLTRIFAEGTTTEDQRPSGSGPGRSRQSAVLSGGGGQHAGGKR